MIGIYKMGKLSKIAREIDPEEAQRIIEENLATNNINSLSLGEENNDEIGEDQKETEEENKEEEEE